MPELIRIILNSTAGLIRLLRRWIFRFILIIGLISLNVATIMSSQVYDSLSNIAWKVVESIQSTKKARPKTVSQLQDDLQASRKKIAEIDANRVAGEKRAKRLEAELTSSHSKSASLEQEIGRLKIQHSELSKAAEVAKKADGKLRKEVTEILRGMKNRVAKTTERNLGSNFLDAIPGIGTITVVGLIGWDMYDACQQFNDVKNLQNLYLEPNAEESETAQKYCGLSRAEMIAFITGEDPVFAICVEARLNTRTLDPPQCRDYPTAWLPSAQTDTSPTRPPSSLYP